jgi:hypothetical protein
MRSCLGTVLVVLVVAAVAPAAHASDERHGPTVGSVTQPLFEIGPDLRLQLPPPSKADPVGDGIGIGALIGAGTGLALMRWAYAQCDDSCDAPEPMPMYLAAGGFGAAVGGVVGWLIDATRKNTSQRVSVAGVVAPKRSQFRVTVRF